MMRGKFSLRYTIGSRRASRQRTCAARGRYLKTDLGGEAGPAVGGASDGREGTGGDSLDGTEWPRGLKQVLASARRRRVIARWCCPARKASWLFSMLLWS
jgi:hypothetical protein